MLEVRGEGCVYRQKGSRFYWIQYYLNGKRIRESAKSDSQKLALKLLRVRLNERDSGILALLGHIPLSSLFESLKRDYVINQRKDLKNLECRWRTHLEPYFASRNATNLTSEAVSLYIEERLKAQASNATVNRELAILKRMYKLAVKDGRLKLSQQPYIEMLQERNVRKGFVRDDQYEKLANATAAVGLWIRGMFELGYVYGWRKSEILSRKVKHLDLSARTLRLEPGETKNSQGRTVFLTAKLYALLAECAQGKGPEDPIFTRNGRPIVVMRQAWEQATKAAGCEGLLFHDLRRTAVRNMVNAGIDSKTAMQNSGHLTANVFDRYHIVNEQDLQRAAEKLEKAAHERERQSIMALQTDMTFPEGKPN